MLRPKPRRGTTTDPLRRISSPRARRGSVYVLVLATATLLSIGGLGAIAVARLQVRRDQQRLDSERAAQLAIAGAHAALAYANTTSGWRAELAKQTAPVSMTIDQRKVRWMILDANGGPVGAGASKCQVVALGTSGTSRRVYSLTATPPASQALDALRCAVHAAGAIDVTGVVDASGPLSSAAKVTNAGTLTGNVEAAAFENRSSFSGLATTPALPKTMPTADTSQVLGAVSIPYSSLSSGTMSKVVLTSTSNPYGLASAVGVYSIVVPSGRTLTISSSRICANLLIVLQANASLVVSGKVLWEPPDTSHASLILVGAAGASVSFQSSWTSPLDESTENVNFNPLLAPHAGVSDGDRSDTYASELRGVFFIHSGTPLTITGNQRIVGCVISEGAVAIGNAQLVADPALLQLPPSGFDVVPDTLFADADSWSWRSYDDFAAVFDR